MTTRALYKGDEYCLIKQNEYGLLEYRGKFNTNKGILVSPLDKKVVWNFKYEDSIEYRRVKQ